MLIAAPAHANVDGVVDQIGTVGEITTTPPRPYTPPAPTNDPIVNPTSFFELQETRPPVNRLPVNRLPTSPAAPAPAPVQADPVNGHGSYSGGPSIGYGYTPPVRVSLDKVNAFTPTATDTKPTTLPTVTTWGTALKAANWKVIAAVGLAIVLVVVIWRRA